MNADKSQIVTATLREHGWTIAEHGHGHRTATHLEHEGRELQIGKARGLTWSETVGTRKRRAKKGEAPRITEAYDARTNYEPPAGNRHLVKRGHSGRSCGARTPTPARKTPCQAHSPGNATSSVPV